MKKESQVLPPTRHDLMRYMVEDSALANAHVTNPLSHMGVGTAVGTPIGALIGAIVAKHRGEQGGKGALAGAIAGGLAGLGLGTITGGIKGSIDIIKNKKRRARHAIEFVSNHGVDDLNRGYQYAEMEGKQAEANKEDSIMGSKTRSVIRRAYMKKRADVFSDWAATLPSRAATSIPGIGAAVRLANLGGTVSGLTFDPTSKENPENSDAKSLLPGIAQHRLAQRARRVADASNAAGKHGTANLVAEVLGQYTGSAIPAAAAGYVGYKTLPKLLARMGLSKHEMQPARIGGTVAAASLGLAVPTVVGAIVAGIRKRRSKQEQIDSDTAGRAVAKYVVPGLATFDSYKRLGASSHYDEKKEKKAAEAGQVKKADIRSFIRAAKLFGGGLAVGGVSGGAIGYGSGYGNAFDRVGEFSMKNPKDWNKADLKLKDKIVARLAQLRQNRMKKSSSVKAAAGFLDTVVGSGKYPYNPGILPKLMANEHLRRALVGAVVSGATAALSSDDHKVRNGLLAALAGGAATYGASATGVLDHDLALDKGMSKWMRNGLRDSTAREITRSMRGPDKNSISEQLRGALIGK